MALSTVELSQIKYYLNYGNLTALARPYFNIALVFETVVQKNIDAWGEVLIRTVILPQLNTLEQTSIPSAVARLAASEVGNIVLNQKELDGLRGHRKFWVERLSVATRVPVAAPPETTDDWGGGGGDSLTVT